MNSKNQTHEGEKGLTLLPPAPNACQVCARDHGPDQAHDGLSLYYGMRFQMKYGRSPTWADALAHLPEDLRSLWKHALQEHNAWTEPDGEVIAETPYRATEKTQTDIDRRPLDE